MKSDNCKQEKSIVECLLEMLQKGGNEAWNIDRCPIGVDDFKKLITKDYYYVDKTLMIKELLDKKGEVNHFTRPRRFGKTLNLSMMRYYFEDTGDAQQNQANAALFDGLAIADAGDAYTGEMGQYPVIMLSLKSAKQNSFEMAYALLKSAIAQEYARHEKTVVGKLENQAVFIRPMGRNASY